jgi:threonine synthase
MIGLKCVVCGRLHDRSETRYTCTACGSSGILDVLYDYETISRLFTRDSLARSREWSQWRYLPVLPIQQPHLIPALRVGWTPLYPARRLGSELGLGFLWVKDEGLNPTASLKDRASSVAVVKALEEGAASITCASTGNAASSLAGCAAAVGLKTHIFVPERAPRAKIAQLLIYGAQVFVVGGSYDQAHDLCEAAAAEWGWYNRNCAVNPYLVEGKKTAGLEICEQLGGDGPDKVFVSVGDGCTIAGIWKGFVEAHRLGLVGHLPQMIGIQADGCQPVKAAFESNRPLKPVVPRTLADSIAVGVPRNWIKAVAAVRESKGQFRAVTDDEILQAMRVLARATGVFAEPAGAAGFAGLLQMVSAGELQRQERVVVVATGNGLKDVESALRAAGQPKRLSPDLDSLRREMRRSES